jgi:hypothetical protein
VRWIVSPVSGTPQDAPTHIQQNRGEREKEKRREEKRREKE